MTALIADGFPNGLPPFFGRKLPNSSVLAGIDEADLCHSGVPVLKLRLFGVIVEQFFELFRRHGGYFYLAALGRRLAPAPVQRRS